MHRANFDAVDARPVRYIIITQGHYDHVGGIDTLRDPRHRGCRAGQLAAAWRDDNERLLHYRIATAVRSRSAAGSPTASRRSSAGSARSCPPQSSATADITVEDTLTLEPRRTAGWS